MPEIKQIHRSLYVIVAVFACIYGLISLVNHYEFRTGAYDLGIFNNAIFDYAHLRSNSTILFEPLFRPRNALADHFDLMLVLLSPLYWLFGSWTLLIMQIVFILFGGFGMYKLIEHISGSSKLAVFALFHFYSIWGIYSALSFDYHSNVVAAMLVPWMIYFFRTGKMAWCTLLFFLVVCCKENMAIWAAFIWLGEAWVRRKEKRSTVRAIAFSLASLFYFFLVTALLMPALMPAGEKYLHFGFSALGNNFKEAIVTVFTRFQYVVTLLFESPLPQSETFGIKTELHFYVLLAGGFALFLRPQYLLMLVPIYAQKLFNDDIVKWGLNSQYSIEFVPILTLAVFDWISGMKDGKRRSMACWLICASTFISSIASMDHRYSKWLESKTIAFYDARHYQNNFDVKRVHHLLDEVPDEVRVSASGPLVPHIAFRRGIYMFPYVADAQLILLLRGSSTFPLSREQFERQLDSLNTAPSWIKFYDANNLIGYRKKDFPFNFKAHAGE